MQLYRKLNYFKCPDCQYEKKDQLLYRETKLVCPGCGAKFKRCVAIMPNLLIGLFFGSIILFGGLLIFSIVELKPIYIVLILSPLILITAWFLPIWLKVYLNCWRKEERQ